MATASDGSPAAPRRLRRPLPCGPQAAPVTSQSPDSGTARTARTPGGAARRKRARKVPREGQCVPGQATWEGPREDRDQGWRVPYGWG